MMQICKNTLQKSIDNHTDVFISQYNFCEYGFHTTEAVENTPKCFIR